MKDGSIHMRFSDKVTAFILASVLLCGCSAKSRNLSEETTSAGFDPAVYSSVLQEYSGLFSLDPLKITIDYTGVREVIEKEGPEKSRERFGYFYKDIKGDPTPELFIVRKEEARYMIVGLYGVSDGTVKCLLRGYSEDAFFLMNDGSIYCEMIKPSGETYYRFTYKDDGGVDMLYNYHQLYGDPNWFTYIDLAPGVSQVVELGKVGVYEPDLGDMEYYDPSGGLMPICETIAAASPT